MNSPRERKIGDEAKPQHEGEKQMPDIATAKFKVSQGKTESLTQTRENVFRITSGNFYFIRVDCSFSDNRLFRTPMRKISV